MNRKETTKFLTDVLISNRLSDRKYYAEEVTLDYGTNHQKRVDVIQFIPQGVLYPSQIEKGEFTFYEIKSCKEDIFSGNGLNFLGERNYIVTTMETYNKILPMLADGSLHKYVKEHYPESTIEFGIMIPIYKDVYEEMENPTPLGGDISDWKMHIIYPCHLACRSKSIVELLFCMLRSK